MFRPLYRCLTLETVEAASLPTILPAVPGGIEPPSADRQSAVLTVER